MLNFGKVSFNDFANSTAVYKNAGYQTYYNFVTKDLQTFYTSDSQEFLVADENSYSPNAIVEITAPSDAEIINFYTPAVFNKDDVYKVNGVVAQVVNLNGEKVLSGWSAGVPITLIYKDNKLFYDIGSGAPAVPTNTLFLDGETVKFDSMSLDVTNPVRTMSVNATPVEPNADKQFAVTKNGHVFMVHQQEIFEYGVDGSLIKKHIIETGVVGYPCNIVSDGQETLYVCTNRCYVLKIDSVTGNIANKPLMKAGDVTAIGWQPTIEYDDGYIYIYPESITIASSVFIEKINATDMSSVERRSITANNRSIGETTYCVVDLSTADTIYGNNGRLLTTYYKGKVYAYHAETSGSSSLIGGLPDIVSQICMTEENGVLCANLYRSSVGITKYKAEGVVADTFGFTNETNFTPKMRQIDNIIYFTNFSYTPKERAPSSIDKRSYMTISAILSIDEHYSLLGDTPMSVGSEDAPAYYSMCRSNNSLFLYNGKNRTVQSNQKAIDGFVEYTIPKRLNNSNTEYNVYVDLNYTSLISVKNGALAAKAGGSIDFIIRKELYAVANGRNWYIKTISGKHVDYTTKVDVDTNADGEYSFIMPSEDVIIYIKTSVIN